MLQFEESEEKELLLDRQEMKGLSYEDQKRYLELENVIVKQIRRYDFSLEHNDIYTESIY